MRFGPLLSRRSRNRFKWVPFYLALLALSPEAVRAQQDAVPPTTVLHINTHLVVIDVVVTDRDGKPIAGLRKDDFQVLEDKDPQTIRSLQYTATEANAASHSKSILILDELNNSIEETNYSKSELGQYLRTLPEILLQPATLVAVDDHGLRELVSYTRDRAALEHALHAESSRIPSDFLRRDYQARFRTTINALWQIARSSEGSADRIELIWVGHGFPSVNLVNVEGDYAASMQTLVQNVSNALLSARAVLYKIDPAPVGAGNMMANPDDVDAAFDDTIEPFADNISFDTLIRQTGGHSFFNRNDVDAEVDRAVRLGSSFYTLAYTPKHSGPDASDYRHIHVTVNRPGAHAITKLGYFTTTVPATSAADPSTAVDAAIISGLDYSALKISVLQCSPDSAGLTLCKLQIQTKDLPWAATSDGHQSASILTGVASYSATHKPLSYTRSPITLHAASPDGLPPSATFTINLRVPEGATSLRFIVFSPAANKMGSATSSASKISP